MSGLGAYGIWAAASAIEISGWDFDERLSELRRSPSVRPRKTPSAAKLKRRAKAKAANNARAVTKGKRA